MTGETLQKIEDAICALPFLPLKDRNLVVDALLDHVPGLVAEVRRLQGNERIRLLMENHP